MKNILIPALLILSPLALADYCTPNLIKENVCELAKKVADGGNKNTPNKISEEMTLLTYKTDGVKLTGLVRFSYNQKLLDLKTNGNQEALSKIESMVKQGAINSVCNGKATKAFINLGGEVEYDYIFNDGSSYTKFTISTCD